MMKKQPCASCRYAVADTTVKMLAEFDGKEKEWVGIECSNSKSEYHKALLNITLGGNPQEDIGWEGCELHEEKEQVTRFENIS